MQGLKQCLLAMYYMWVNNDQEWNDSREGSNGKGVVYRFVTTGQHDV